ncbi:hypothetical protein [Actinoplanes sp. DH11]|uniref:DUF6903 family protein n=1 Tax=Actinoplanes sp. DH11 TaxID=2857011 RepID=UPI001E2B3315|nr:hypothetical protein [Actinoplanes sp. DH11]
MNESTRAALIVTGRTLTALACVVVVVLARPAPGWGRLAVMLGALAVLLLLLAGYNRKFRS